MWHFGLFGHLWMQRDRSGVLPGLFLANQFGPVMEKKKRRRCFLQAGLFFSFSVSLVSSFLLYICITMGSRFLSPWKPEDATTHECFSFCYLAEMWPAAWKGNEELNQAISLLHFLQISVRRRQMNVSVYRIKGRQVQFVIYTSTFGSVCAPSLASPTENCPHTFINYFSWPTYPVQGRWGGLESVPAHVVLL